MLLVSICTLRGYNTRTYEGKYICLVEYALSCTLACSGVAGSKNSQCCTCTGSQYWFASFYTRQHLSLLPISHNILYVNVSKIIKNYLKLLDTLGIQKAEVISLDYCALLKMCFLPNIFMAPVSNIGHCSQ